MCNMMWSLVLMLAVTRSSQGEDVKQRKGAFNRISNNLAEVKGNVTQSLADIISLETGQSELEAENKALEERVKKLEELLEESNACPPEYHKSTNPLMCYKLHPEKITWAKARDACAAKGERLIFLDTEGKFATVKDVIRNNATTKRMTFSVGAEDLDQDGVWYWLDRTKVTFSAWRSKHPGPGSGCLNLNPGASHLWNDAVCSRSFSYICEKTLE